MTKRKFILIALLPLLVVIGYLVYTLGIKSPGQFRPIYLVPKDAVFIIESNSPVSSWQKIGDSDLWGHLIQNPYLNRLTGQLQDMDALFKENSKLSKLFKDRSLYISVHMKPKREYGLLYVIDLKKLANLELVKSNLNGLLGKRFKLSKRDYHEHNLFEIYDNQSKSTLNLAFVKNQMVVSYDHQLLEAAIDQIDEPFIGRHDDFVDISEKIGYEDLFRIYIQHNFLNDYAKYLIGESPQWNQNLSKAFSFSGFQLDFDGKNTIEALGYSKFINENDHYLKALQESGKVKALAQKVAPTNTAVMVNYGFEDFKRFYHHVNGILKERDSLTYAENIHQIKKLENYLKIDLEEHFVDWIDSEIALLHLNNHHISAKNDLALAIKYKDLDQARESLRYVANQIKKKTPVKFKSITYKRKTIRFLSIKGIFNMLLGKRFAEISKPYYTIMDEYVVFSSNPNTLKSIIDHYEKGETLHNDTRYQEFKQGSERSTSVSLYANNRLLYKNALEMFGDNTNNVLSQHKEHLTSFDQIGMDISPGKDFFKTRIKLSYDPNQSASENLGPNRKKQNDSSPIVGTTRSVFDLDPIYPDDLNAKEYTVKFNDGTVRYKVELKNGLKHGQYIKYYPDGQKMLTGRFRKDKQVGSWRFYGPKGDLAEKKRF